MRKGFQLTLSAGQLLRPIRIVLIYKYTKFYWHNSIFKYLNFKYLAYRYNAPGACVRRRAEPLELLYPSNQ